MRTALIVIGVLLVAAAAVRVLVVTDTQGFRAKSGAMEPTIELEERFTVNKDAYDEEAPERFDIVVFRPPERAIPDAPEEAALLMRVVALPGERVRVVDGRAVVDGKRLDEPYVNDDNCLPDTCTFRGGVKVPDGHFFVMGDNRGASEDSRFWGAVPRADLIGRVDDCWPFGLRCTEDDRTG